jgi:hypothetical protein
MGDGGVSAAFPYLNHKIPDPVKPVYVEGPKPLTFNELYSPRDESVFSPINSQDKSFWRTRDTISFSIYELRCKNLMLVTCRDSSNSTNVYRTIALDLAKLYFEVESKARGSRDLLVRKKEKALPDDAALHKAAASYILARLNIGAEPLPWPESFALSTDAALPTDELASLPTESPPVHKEKMVTFSFLSGDSQVLEVPIASLQGFPLPGIDPASLKLAPAAPPAAAPFPVAAAAAPLPAAAGTADASAPVEQPTPAALSLPQLSSPPKPRAHKAKDKAPSNKLPAVSPAHKGRGKG